MEGKEEINPSSNAASSGEASTSSSGASFTDQTLLHDLIPDKSAPFIYLSREGRPFGEAWQPFLGGLFRNAPIPVYYKNFYQAAELIAAVTSHSSFGLPGLPPIIKVLLEEHQVTDCDYSFVISDVSNTINHPKCGPILNLSLHAWYFPDTLLAEVMQGRRIEIPLQVGIFTFGGGGEGHQSSGIEPMANGICMPFQCLDTLPMTIHPQRGGGLCCSPNNCRFVLNISSSSPISHFWSVAIIKSDQTEQQPTKASVSLQWILHQPLFPELVRQLRVCANLQAVLDLLRQLFGGGATGQGGSSAVAAACLMFGYGKEGELSRYGQKTETVPLKNERKTSACGEGGDRARGERRRGGGGHRGRGEGRGGGRRRGSRDGQHGHHRGVEGGRRG